MGATNFEIKIKDWALVVCEGTNFSRVPLQHVDIENKFVHIEIDGFSRITLFRLMETVP